MECGTAESREDGEVVNVERPTSKEWEMENRSGSDAKQDGIME